MDRVKRQIGLCMVIVAGCLFYENSAYGLKPELRGKLARRLPRHDFR